jgi:lipopolysaccharide heptosyltransferase II
MRCERIQGLKNPTSLGTPAASELRNDTDKKSWKKIVVFRTDRLGDLVLSLPVVEALKAFLPEAQVDLFVSPYAVPVARLQRNASAIIADRYPGLPGLFALARFLRSQQYDLAVHLFPVPRLALAAFLARVPVRAGTLYRYFSPLFNRRIRLHRKKAGMHERDLNLKLLEGVGVPIGQVAAGLEIPDRLRKEVAALLAAKGIDASREGFLVLHPGSGGSSLNWPPEHFGSLGREMRKRGIPVVLTGSGRDRPVVDRVRSCMDAGGTDLCGELDLEQLAALLSSASLVVTNSTGPLHLADALGTKVIGIFSPYLSAGPHRWGPYGQPENVFVPDGELCPRCTRDRCERHNCLETIRPEAVLQRALELLAPAR